MNSMERFAQRLLRVEKGLKKLATTPQLAYSSVEGGTLDFNDQDGNTGIIVGPQHDLTNAVLVVSGPTPAAPAGVNAEAFLHGAAATWDGTWSEGLVAPLDFARVEIHASQEGPDFIPDVVGAPSTTLMGSFSSPRGGRYGVNNLAPGDWYFRFVARTTTGKFSAATTAIGPITPQAEVAPPVAPTTSPAITVTGTAEGVVIEAEPVDPGTVIEYHVSTTEGFALDATTLSVETVATVYYMMTLPGGERLEPGVQYYFRALARNAAGPATGGASAEVPGTLNPNAVSDLILGTLTTGFILTGTIQLGQITIDANTGITVPQLDGGTITIPADGSPATFSGSVVTSDLIVETNAVLNGISSIVGELKLLSGIPDPATPPEVFSYLKDVEPSLPSATDGYRGLAFSADGTVAYTAQDPYNESAPLYAVNYADNGSVIATHETGGATLVYGLTRIGSLIYVLFYNFNQNRLQVNVYQHLTGEPNFTLNTSYAMITDTTWDVNHRPAIGTDGTNLIIGYRNMNGFVRAEKRSPATGNYISHVVLDDGGSLILSLSSIEQGNFDFGSGRIVVSQDTIINNQRMVYVFNTDGTRDSASDWVSHWGGAIAWNPAAGASGRFVEKTHQSSGLREFTGIKVPTSRQFRYTWLDNNATGGTHETAASPASAAVTIPARYWAYVRCASAPQKGSVEQDAANQCRVYIGTTSSTFLKWTISVGNRSVIFAELSVPGTNPHPTTNSFSALGSSGIITAGIEDADGPLIKLSGLGNSRLGPLFTTGTDFTLKSFATDAAGIPLINLAGDGEIGHDTGNLSGTGNYSGTVRVLRFGEVVFLSGSLVRTGAPSGAFEDTGVVLPIGTRPTGAAIHFEAQPFYNTALTSGGRTATYRFRVLTTGELQCQANETSTQEQAVNGMLFIN